MKILVTGAAGFIGSSLCEQLIKDGNEVYGIDNFDPYYSLEIKHQNLKYLLSCKRFKFETLDILDQYNLQALFRREQFDSVVHLAAKAGVRPSIEDPIGYTKTNVEGTVNILESAKNNQCRKLVIASSSSVYGNNRKVPFAESDSVDGPISPYAATKKSTELLGHVYHAISGLDLIFLRFFTVYGPRQRPDLAINKFVTSIDQGKPIHLFGDGSTSRDYTFISDIVGGIESSLHYLQNHENVYEIINLGSNNPISLNELVSLAEKVCGKRAIKLYEPMQSGDVERTFADVSKAHSLLNYEPRVAFEEGLRSFYLWLKKTEGGLKQ